MNHEHRCPVCGSKLFDNAKFCYNCDSDISKETEKHEKAQCFIATAAYGTKFAHEVKILRKFRDNVLKKSSLGVGFIRLYYKISPKIAKIIGRNEFLKIVTRGILKVIIVFIKRVL